MFLVDIIEDELNSEKQERKDLKEKKQTVCACGRKVCCGKNKNGQCSCHVNVKEHD